ncbi:MAG: PaaI family thioesterase [Phycisphaerae bacterium]|nr:PaaI family thioesterase [Phycisphaerae bacterium]
MTIESASTKTAADLAGRCHPSCIVCGARNGDSLGLRFVQEADGTVIGSFACDDKYQGYPDRLHGGVIAMLADAAMTHWLFLHRISAVTAKLKLRFPRPVEVGVPATVRAAIVRNSPPMFVLKAQISQAGTVRATAEGLFIEQQLDAEDT